MRTVLWLCRLLVGGTFICYGIVKLLGGQFHYGDFVIDSRTTDGTWLVWCFFGYSPIYGRFIGLCELIPGLLLLVPRTRTLGALALLPVGLNITVMDFCFDFPSVKYFSLLLTLLCALLVAADYRKLLVLLEDDTRRETTDINRKEKLPLAAAVAAGRGRLQLALLGVVGVVFAVPLVNLTAIATTTGPEQAALDRCVAEGWPASDLSVRQWRRTKGDFGIAMEATVDVAITQSGTEKIARIFLERPWGLVGWKAVRIDYVPTF
jgi:hypothetical protein